MTELVRCTERNEMERDRTGRDGTGRDRIRKWHAVLRDTSHDCFGRVPISPALWAADRICGIPWTGNERHFCLASRGRSAISYRPARFCAIVLICRTFLLAAYPSHSASLFLYLPPSASPPPLRRPIAAFSGSVSRAMVTPTTACRDIRGRPAGNARSHAAEFYSREFATFYGTLG